MHKNAKYSTNEDKNNLYLELKFERFHSTLPVVYVIFCDANTWQAEQVRLA